jgi:hypothetical protein
MAVAAAATGVRVEPIGDADMQRAATFLHEHLNGRVSVEHWAQAADLPWPVDRPNAGFMLLDGDELVGVQLAFYSERDIDGRTERFCNLAGWCVLPEYRFHSIRMLKTVLSQKGYHFTDLSPNPHVAGVNARLKFQYLDTATSLVPNLPWPGRGTLSSDPELIECTLTGAELELYRDHARSAAARHLVLIRGGEWCYVIFRKDRRKQLPLFVSLLHVSNPELFRKMFGSVARHLLFRHGAPATLAEERVLGYRPRLALRLRSPRRKMFRSANLEPAQIDYLYSELVCVPW